jgi:ribonuclease P protein subunit RPR2
MQMILQQIHVFFKLAQNVVHEDPKLAQHYVDVARKVAMAKRMRMPEEYRRMVCRHCKSFILPGVSCRVRLQPRREPHLTVTCFNCGKHMRIPLKKGREK